MIHLLVVPNLLESLIVLFRVFANGDALLDIEVDCRDYFLGCKFITFSQCLLDEQIGRVRKGLLLKTLQL